MLAKTVTGEQVYMEPMSENEHLPGHLNSHSEHIDAAEADVRRIPDSDTELIMKYDVQNILDDCHILLSSFIFRFAINKTQPEPCDNQMSLYSLVHYSDRNVSSSGYNKSMVDCGRYVKFVLKCEKSSARIARNC